MVHHWSRLARPVLQAGSQPDHRLAAPAQEECVAGSASQALNAARRRNVALGTGPALRTLACAPASPVAEPATPTGCAAPGPIAARADGHARRRTPVSAQASNVPAPVTPRASVVTTVTVQRRTPSVAPQRAPVSVTRVGRIAAEPATATPQGLSAAAAAPATRANVAATPTATLLMPRIAMPRRASAFATESYALASVISLVTAVTLATAVQVSGHVARRTFAHATE